MVREFPELQGTMGGIYAREEGQPEAVWKAIYYQYLPVGVEADAPPSRAQLGAAAVTWAAVSLADKLDTVVGLFTAGERPTGSRDPFGLRRQAQGVVQILMDLPELDRRRSRARPARLWSAAANQQFGGRRRSRRERRCRRLRSERVRYLLEQRGFDVRSRARGDHAGVERRRVRSTRAAHSSRRCREMRGVGRLPGSWRRCSSACKNIAQRAATAAATTRSTATALTEPAELALLAELDARAAARSSRRRERRDYREAFAEVAGAAAGRRPVLRRSVRDGRRRAASRPRG